MRRWVCALVVLIVAGWFAASTSSSARATSTPGPRVTCGVSTLTFLFWPQGHQAIPSIGFPAFQVPHLEVYRTDPAFPSGNQVAYAGLTADRTRAGGAFAKSCAAVAARSFKPTPSVRTTADTTRLVCKFPKAARLDYVTTDSPASVTMRAFVPIKTKKRKPAALTLVVSAHLENTTAALKYDAKLCKANAPPS